MTPDQVHAALTNRRMFQHLLRSCSACTNGRRRYRHKTLRQAWQSSRYRDLCWWLEALLNDTEYITLKGWNQAKRHSYMNGVVDVLHRLPALSSREKATLLRRLFTAEGVYP